MEEEWRGNGGEMEQPERGSNKKIFNTGYVYKKRYIYLSTAKARCLVGAFRDY